jgi:DNA-binding NarL/FixJ family response regulator
MGSESETKLATRRATVVVADAHAATRAGVRSALATSRFDVVGEATSASAAVETVRRHRPDLLVLDIGIPGGLRAAAEATAAAPETKLVVMTASDDEADLFDALRIGAVGYLPKDFPAAELPGALESVAAGGAVLPPTLLARVVAELRAREGRRLNVGDARLTDREWDVLDLLHRGQSTAEIASRLFVSTGTVRTHVSAILRKLSVSSRAEAVALLDRR